MDVLRSSIQSEQFDEFAHMIRNGLVENNQISRGKFNGFLKTMVSKNVIISHLAHNQNLLQQGISAPGYISFLFWEPAPNFYWRYRRLQNNNLAVVWNIEHHSLTGSNFEGMPISIQEDFFIETCIANGKEELVERLKKESLFVIDKAKLKYVRSFVVAALSKPWESKELETQVMDLILDCFEDGTAELSVSNKIEIRDILEYIMDCPDTIKCISDITEEFGISPRTLRHRFSRELNISPKHFLNAVKLNKVYSELKYGPNSQFVKTIAGQYDFWHMSQFAKDFKRQFGILPRSINS